MLMSGKALGFMTLLWPCSDLNLVTSYIRLHYLSRNIEGYFLQRNISDLLCLMKSSSSKISVCRPGYEWVNGNCTACMSRFFKVIN